MPRFIAEDSKSRAIAQRSWSFASEKAGKFLLPVLDRLVAHGSSIDPIGTHGRDVILQAEVAGLDRWPEAAAASGGAF